MSTPFVSRFNPGLMDRDTLEALFVQRERLAENIVTSIQESVSTGSRKHVLLLGPRGIGKTCLIAIVYHRIRALVPAKGGLLIAWLREDEYGITSLLDLIVRIVDQLDREYPLLRLRSRIESLYNFSGDEAERQAKALLSDVCQGQTLLLLMENLDEVFAGLADNGQQRLRSYIQEEPFWTIVASSQSLFNGVSLRTSPFYGFFTLHHLQPLTLDEAVKMLVNIAEVAGDSELASALHSSDGIAKVRVIHHLAGGNHRVFVIFSQFMSGSSLHELVEPFMRTLDDLTPYYQSRMTWLSYQQRKIIEFLCNQKGAVSVKEIAQRCFLTSQTVSSQLKDLRDKNYVQSNPVGRESYYELVEPLLRLSIEAKQHQGEPIRTLVEFLRAWYSQAQLRERLDNVKQHGASGLEISHIEAALAEYDVRSIAKEQPDIDELAQVESKILERRERPDEQSWGPINKLIRQLASRLALRHMVDSDDLVQESGLQIWKILTDSAELERLFPRTSQASWKSLRSFVIGMVAGVARSMQEKAEFQMRAARRFEPYLDSQVAGESSKLEPLARVSSEIEYRLLEAADNPSHLSKEMENLLTLAIKFEVQDILSATLVQCLPKLLETKGKKRALLLENWRHAAQRVFGSLPEFRIPLRLLDATVTFIETRDVRVLLTLPIEERTLVKQLLGNTNLSDPAGSQLKV
jgi:DNA-binding transcriptional ArsR family regulator